MKDKQELRESIIEKMDFIEEYGNDENMSEWDITFIDDISIKIRKNEKFNITWPIQKQIIRIYKQVESDIG